MAEVAFFMRGMLREHHISQCQRKYADVMKVAFLDGCHLFECEADDVQKMADSIRKRPLNIILIVLVVLLYVFNNKFIKVHTDGIIRDFFVCYFNDLMCPYFFLSYANLLLITCDKEIMNLKGLLAIGIVSGLVWEFVAPLLKKGSVTDYMDLLCYIISTIGYWGILKIPRREENAGS